MRICSRVAGEIMTTLTAQQIACVYAWLAQ
ncbi:molecular chaperone TorD, partial [Shigella flexneri]